MAFSFPIREPETDCGVQWTPPIPEPLMRPLRGIAFKLASVLVFIVMASMIKATAAHVPAGQAVFFRSFFAIPVIVSGSPGGTNCGPG
jgi:hypothetical protein